jgi:hypothetical protein
MWGARGPFPPVAAMVVAVVTPIVFCAKATEKFNKNTKISHLYEIFVFLPCVVKHIKNHVTLIVVWPMPKL